MPMKTLINKLSNSSFKLRLKKSRLGAKDFQQVVENSPHILCPSLNAKQPNFLKPVNCRYAHKKNSKIFR
jgi:hypothetical protein